jgi:hypothetical protein
MAGIGQMHVSGNSTNGLRIAGMSPHFLNPYATLLGFYPTSQADGLPRTSGVRFGATDEIRR